MIATVGSGRPISARRCRWRLGVDHHVVVLDADREGLGDVRTLDQGAARLDRDGEVANAGAMGLAPGFAGAQVVFPAVPGAADDLAVARVAVLAGPRGLDQPYELALAQTGALVRATIEQGEELALHVE